MAITSYEKLKFLYDECTVKVRLIIAHIFTISEISFTGVNR